MQNSALGRERVCVCVFLFAAYLKQLQRERERERERAGFEVSQSTLYLRRLNHH